MRVLIVATTGHPEAILESARFFFSQNSSIRKIVVVSTHLMKSQGHSQRLIENLKSLQDIEIEEIILEAGIEDNNMHAICSHLSTWISNQSHHYRYIFNVTGGTKLLSIAFDRVASSMGVNRAEAFYQTRENEIVWYQRQNGKTVYEINSNLDVIQRIQSRGYHIVSSESASNIGQAEHTYINLLIGLLRADFNRGMRFCSYLHKLCSEADKDLEASIQYIQDDTLDGLNVLEQLTEQSHFLIDHEKQKVIFRNDESRDFMKGGWFEYHTATQFYKILSDLEAHTEVLINVEFNKNDTQNEMDLMFTHDAHLYSIECKAAKTMKTNKAQDVLYKLQALEDIGGINHRLAIVSLFNLSESDLRRAKNANIKIFAEEDILNLNELIQQWLTQR